MEDEAKKVKKKKIRYAVPQLREFAELHNKLFKEMYEVAPKGTSVKAVMLLAAYTTMESMKGAQ